MIKDFIKIGDFIKFGNIFGYAISVDDHNIIIIDEDKKVYTLLKEEIDELANLEKISHTTSPLEVISAMIENERIKYYKKRYKNG